MSETPTIPRPLIWRWWAVLLLYVGGMAAIAAWLNTTPWGEQYIGRWMALTTAVAIYELALLYRHLDDNHRNDTASILPTIGLGNTLTLLRGLLLAMLGGFIFSPRPHDLLAWFPVILYTGSDLLDAIDGLAARQTNHQTKLGETLDIEFDALGIALVVGLCMWYGQLPWWYISLALARYLFIWGMQWRERHNRPIYPLTSSKYRRMLAGFQMGFLSAALWPVIPSAVATLAGIIFIVPTLIVFWRDWLIVSGRIDPHAEAYQHRRHQIIEFIVGWLPLPTRLLLLITAVIVGIFPPAWQGPTAWIALFHSWRWVEPWATWAAVALAWATALLLLCVFLGVWARWLAFALVFGAAVNLIATLQIDNYWSWSAALFLVCTLILFFTDSGYYSLWKPDDSYMYVPLGVKTHE